MALWMVGGWLVVSGGGSSLRPFEKRSCKKALRAFSALRDKKYMLLQLLFKMSEHLAKSP